MIKIILWILLLLCMPYMLWFTKNKVWNPEWVNILYMFIIAIILSIICIELFNYYNPL